MLRKIGFILILIHILILSSAFAGSLTSIIYDGETHPYTARDVTLMLNNDKFEPSEGQMPPILLNNRTLVPVREVFEYLGGEVFWTDSERRVDVTFEDTKISLWINSLEATKNGKKLKLDVPAKIINNKTMVPVRFISENADLMVGWNAEEYIVDVKYQKAKITNIGFATINGVNCLVAKADKKITGYKYFSLPKDDQNPLRLVLDIENCEFTFDTTNAKFEQGMLQGIRFGKQSNDVNRIVLDLRDDTDYVVTLSEDRLKLYFAMAKEFIDPDAKKQEDNPVIPKEEKLDAHSLSGEASEKNESNAVSSEKPEETSSVKSGELPDSKSPNVTKENAKEELIELQEKSGENILVDTSLEIPKAENTSDNADIVQILESEDETVEEDIKFDTTITSIKYSAASKRIKIKYTGDMTFHDSILTNPNRIVIDIDNAKLDTTGPTEIDVKNSIVTDIRFSQYTKTSVRIVFDLANKGEYKIYKRSSELQIEVEETNYKNIKYKKNTSNSQITLLNATMEDFSFTQNEEMFKYIVKFNAKDYDFGIGMLTPDDSYVKSITVLEGSITIADTGDKYYAVRQSGSNVVITIRVREPEPEPVIEPELIAESGEMINNSGEQEVNIEKKIVVIDVGHGGKDPGAGNGDYEEKDFNLNIAKELYRLLEARDDVEVYIDRTSDIYLSREDRVAYANEHNPDLIVSCHINAVENKSYSGTMVLYYNNETESDYGDITSEECAKIVQSKLVKALGTIDRGVVNRSDLHILSKTPCPSILCEVCFISNDAELQKLKTKSFQNNAAKAICDGVVEILKEM